jgi:polar amino acid transport system substrate-binding protein
MTTNHLSHPPPARFSGLVRSIVAALALTLLAGAAAAAESPSSNLPLKVAVYDVPPYGSVEPDGAIDGVSVDLWRRAAEVMGRQYHFVPVSQMEAILEGLERNEFDAAIGAITITPDRLARVDFSYPAHRSGVAVAVRREHGAVAAFRNYGAVVTELSPLIALTFALLVAMGVAMWLVEKPMRSATHDSAVATLRDGVYWAVVTMTTVGYGDKTPKTTSGRVIAIAWMLVSLALVSILSTAIVSKMTADRLVGGGARLSDADLEGRRLAAVAHSSGAEYLDERRLPYTPYDDLPGALTALGAGRADAVVNSIGTLQYLVAARFQRTVEAPEDVLAPAYMAFALPHGSALKEPLDRALIEITASPEWRRIEQSYFVQ